VSRAEEFIYDHPFQWGSKRTGPDLAREGGKYPHLWHYTHLVDPRAISAGSNMPSFKWLTRGAVDTRATGKKLALMQKLGVPYSNADVDEAEASLRRQGEGIVTELAAQGVQTRWNAEIVALIGYLQRLGRAPQPAPAGTGNTPVAQAAGGN
jgi:cytochrome c oxidase cbb3-type subunit I/II